MIDNRLSIVKACKAKEDINGEIGNMFYYLNTAVKDSSERNYNNNKSHLARIKKIFG